MDVSSSTPAVSFCRSIPLQVVLSVNADLASLFYHAWPQDWILSGFLESTIPQSPSPYGFSCNMSALWTWEYCKQQVCVWNVLLRIFRAHSSKEVRVLVCSEIWKSFSPKEISSYIHKQPTDKPDFTKYWSDPKAFCLKFCVYNHSYIGKVTSATTSSPWLFLTGKLDFFIFRLCSLKIVWNSVWNIKLFYLTLYWN